MALRNEVIAAIAFVLRLRIGAQLRRTLGLREEADARILAEKIVSHLEQSRFRLSQEPPPPLHGTPRRRDPPEQP